MRGACVLRQFAVEDLANGTLRKNIILVANSMLAVVGKGNVKIMETLGSRRLRLTSSGL